MNCIFTVATPARRAPSGIVAEGVELATGRRARDQEPGRRHRRDHAGHRQGERSARAERNDRDAIGPPVRQVVDRLAGRREHQEAEQGVERRDGDDDRDDAKTGDQGGVDAADGDAEERPRTGSRRSNCLRRPPAAKAR